MGNHRTTTPRNNTNMNFPMTAILTANKMARRKSQGDIVQVTSKNDVATSVTAEGLELHSRHGALAACVSSSEFLMSLPFASMRQVNSYKSQDGHIVVFTFKESMNLGGVTTQDAPTKSLMLETEDVKAANAITEGFQAFQFRTFKGAPPMTGIESEGMPGIVAPEASRPVHSANLGLAA